MPRNLKRKQVSDPSPSSTKNEVIETDPNLVRMIYDYLCKLPSGFMFKPTDVQLICNYLRPKIANQPLPPCLIHPVNLYAFHPKTLSDNYLKHPEVDELYCFTPRDRKYKNGSRPSRGVDGIGFWKATGADVKIKIGDEVIGSVRTLTFYEGPHKTGIKTNWIMHEYRTCESRERISKEDMKLDDWVLCKLREKEETVPSNNKNNVEAPMTTTNTSDSDTGTAAVNDDNIIPDCEATKTTTNIGVSDIATAASDDNIIPDCDDLEELGNSLFPVDYNTSYYNELYQSSHQHMQHMQLPFKSLPVDTSQQNFNLANDYYYTQQVFSNELCSIPGPSFANEVPRDVADFYDQWDADIHKHDVLCSSLFGWSAPAGYEDSDGSSSDLKMKDADED